MIFKQNSPNLQIVFRIMLATHFQYSFIGQNFYESHQIYMRSTWLCGIYVN